MWQQPVTLRFYSSDGIAIFIMGELLDWRQRGNILVQ